MKKMFALIFGLVLCAVPAFAASWTYIDGGVSGGAGFIGVGSAEVNGGFGAEGLSNSRSGFTESYIEGGFDGGTHGRGIGVVNGSAGAEAGAFQGFGMAVAGASVGASANASIYGRGSAGMSAGAEGGAIAVSW